MSTLKNRVFRKANKLFPKFNNIVVSGSNTIESNAVEIANYLSENTEKNIYFLVTEEYMNYLREIVSERIKIINSDSFLAYLLLLTSKYVFSTHGSSLAGSSDRQVEINIWHGILYKNIRLLRDEPGLAADITVGTSPLSQKMFSEAFGVPKYSVYISGYPRNDMMLRSSYNIKPLKDKIGVEILGYDKIVFWMPTFRRTEGVMANPNMELNNPFQVEKFDVDRFNSILKKENTLCILKPHYYYMTGEFEFEYSNIKMIDDSWIAQKGITLYELLACADILVSDFSSVMYDYTLLNRPIICFCTDLEEYKRTQGLYFEDIENWLPSKLIQNQEEFFEHLTLLLKGEEDPYLSNRHHVRNIGFTYDDANSTERLCDYVFGKYD